MSIHAPAKNVSQMETVGVRPPYDPAVLKGMEALPPSTFESVETIRKTADTFTADSFLSANPNMEHVEYTVPGPKDHPTGNIILSVFKSRTSTNTKRVGFYNIHGGGQIAGNRFSALAWVTTWFSGIDVVVVSVEYRLAPEHPAPAAVNDAYCGLVWMADHAAELNIDPSRLIIAGGSGGGPIAAGCAILARNHQYPTLCAQLLSCPMMDDRCDTVSSRQFEEIGPWDGKTNRMAWDHVLGSRRGRPDVSELISPARATDLSGVAPAFIDVGVCEVFRDEDVAYAMQLWKCGVSADLHVWAGAYHGFEYGSAETPVAKEAAITKRAWVRRVLGITE